jgi:hypothetical protein
MQDVVVADRAIDLPDHEHGQYATELSWISFHRKRSPAARAVCNALKAWRYHFNIAPADTWIMDAALQTVAFAALRGSVPPGVWVFYPPEPWPRFVPSLRRSAWLGHPLSESWPKFAKRMRFQFAEQLKQYRRTIQSLSFSEDLEKKEERDAGWLARYVGGESWDEIAATVSEEIGNPKSSVRNNSLRLAKRIGLKVPKRAPGRRPKP